MNLYYVWYDQKLEEFVCLEKDDMDKQYQNLKKQLINDECELLLIQALNRKEAFEEYRKEIKELYEDDTIFQNKTGDTVFENIFEGDKEKFNEFALLHDDPEYNFTLPQKRRVFH
jgi:hypothetical protein